MDNPGKTGKRKQVPLILAVETSSRVGSVALALGPNLLEVSAFSAPLRHSNEIFPTIDRLLQRRGYGPPGIEQIHISIGPGSFTGLRIAVTMAKTMHLAGAVKVVTVDSLDVVVANLSDTCVKPTAAPHNGRGMSIPDRIVSLFDAKRGQFYAAVYERVAAGSKAADSAGYRIPAPENTSWHKIAPDRLMSAREIIDGFAGTHRIGLLGDGLLYHRDQFDTGDLCVLPEPWWGPSAANVHRLGYQKALAGRFADPLTLTPLYLRGPQVTLKKTP
jgi:tRNA threonylcarbamoyladenosine biosynthesis protein TsaB